ncbi:MAG: hypothetical protein NT076_03720 [Candidatus Pacearchaeota archaeon]|nr:hypothetical protein [Candidatus Pacearchaeota archaeon]
MARKKGNVCRATKGQKKELKTCYKDFGKNSKKCKAMRREICPR